MAQSTRRTKTAPSEAVAISIVPDDDVYSHDSLSVDPRSNLRLVLLGGDCVYKKNAAEVILRSNNTNSTINPKKGTFREGTVNGRQVSVFAAPSYWMSHLASYWIFSNGVESIRGEIQNCTSLMFPGPHAFLLVMRAGHTSGKEHYLLRALTYMFGEEALQYTMVLFVHGHEVENPDVLKNRCVKMCGKKYFNLENSDENVEELFRRIHETAQKNPTRIFVQHSYEKLMKMCYNSWESSRLCSENNLKTELTEIKSEIGPLRQSERDLRKELEECRCHASALENELEVVRQLGKKLQELQGSEAEALKKVKRNSKDEPPKMSENQDEPRENR